MINALEFGTAPLGNLFKEISDEQAWATLEAAWDGGIRRFDTAPHYGLGLAERRLGAFLQTKPRGHYIVSTKVGRLLVPQPATGDDLANGFAVPNAFQREWRSDADGVRRSLDESLERLGLDFVDVLYLHDPDESGLPLAAELATGIDSLTKVRDEGLVARVGVGSKSEEALAMAFAHDVDQIMCSNRYSLVDRSAAERVFPAAIERAVAVVAVSIYSSGLLARPRPAADAHDEYGPASPERLALANRLADLAESHGVDLPTVAVQFPLRHDAVGAIAVGASKPEQVTQSIERLTTTIPAALWRDLDGIEVGS